MVSEPTIISVLLYVCLQDQIIVVLSTIEDMKICS